MSIYIEGLILYVVLFFSASAGWFGAGAAEGFSAGKELFGVIMYCIPSIALIWYFLIKAKPLKEWNIKPGLNDLISGAIALPCLILTGLVTAFASTRIGAQGEEAMLQLPSSTLGWIILCFSRIFAAYLEESFFRFYILSRKEELKISASCALVLSTALFSVCHIYEGPWGFLNAVISGAILAFVFLRYNALHGIAIAHGLYNISVYAVNFLLAGTAQN